MKSHFKIESIENSSMEELKGSEGIFQELTLKSFRSYLIE